jgi:hypothetical protein
MIPSLETERMWARPVPSFPVALPNNPQTIFFQLVSRESSLPAIIHHHILQSESYRTLEEPL